MSISETIGVTLPSASVTLPESRQDLPTHTIPKPVKCQEESALNSPTEIKSNTCPKCGVHYFTSRCFRCSYSNDSRTRKAFVIHREAFVLFPGLFFKPDTNSELIEQCKFPGKGCPGCDITNCKRSIYQRLKGIYFRLASPSF